MHHLTEKNQKDMNKLLKWGYVQIMSALGTLNCRGLLECLLAQVSAAKNGENSCFNASQTCEHLQKDSTIEVEKFLVDTAIDICDTYPSGDHHHCLGTRDFSAT